MIAKQLNINFIILSIACASFAYPMHKKKQKASISKKEQRKLDSALEKAVVDNCVPNARYLLKQGANARTAYVTEVAPFGIFSPVRIPVIGPILLCAVQNQDITMVELLLNAGAYVPSCRSELLSEALFNYDNITLVDWRIVLAFMNKNIISYDYVTKGIQRVLRKWINFDQDSFLFAICDNEHFEYGTSNRIAGAEVALLLGASVNARSADERCTPLFFAINNHDLEMIEWLKEHGANIEATDINQRTPLLHAVHYSTLTTVKTLIALGANTEARDYSNETALFRVIDGYLDRGEKMKYLLDNGANIEAANRSYSSPLTKAFNKADFISIRILLEYGAEIDLNNQCNTCSSILSNAIRHDKKAASYYTTLTLFRKKNIPDEITTHIFSFVDPEWHSWIANVDNYPRIKNRYKKYVANAYQQLVTIDHKI